MNRTFRLWLEIAVLGFALVTWSSSAHADDKAEARIHVAAADTHFKLGRFSDALAEYTKAYELYPTPPLLFNLGQCHRNLKNWDKAVFFFEGYLRERPDAKNRAVVDDLLREAHAEIEKQHAAEVAKQEDDARKMAESQTAKLHAEEAMKLRIDGPGKGLGENRVSAALRVGVVVAGDPSRQGALVTQLQGWVQQRGFFLVGAPFDAETYNRFLDCFLLEDMACARGLFEAQSAADVVVLARVDRDESIGEAAMLTAYGFVRGRDTITEKRRCKPCDDRVLEATTATLIDAIARQSGMSERQLDDERRVAEVRRAQDDRVRKERAGREHDDRFYRKWWFWSAVGSTALVLGGAAYYFSGSTTLISPTGNLGGLDRR